jgi:hypothetical protein
MIKLSIWEDGSELNIDYQGGVGITIITPDKQQIDFSFEPHEWEVVKAFLENQKAVEERLQADAAMSKSEERFIAGAKLGLQNGLAEEVDA